MSIQKKSLISTLKTTKKANVATAPLSGSTGAKTGKMFSSKHTGAKYATKKMYARAYGKKGVH